MRVARASMCLTILALFLTLTLAPPQLAAHDSGLIHPLLSVKIDSQSVWRHLQVGAWGNQDSIGSLGVQAEIQTQSYNVSGSDEDAFWIGSILKNGAFIQFGYLLLSPGYYCLTAHVSANGTACTGANDNVSPGDARWFWAYFPNSQKVDEWYYGFGLSNSAGANNTWHLYSIQPSDTNNWSFEMDGVSVYTLGFQAVPSSSPAHFVAEKASGPDQQRLGPVEFRNLAYLGDDGQWHGTSSLTPIVGCGEGDTIPCDSTMPYGVAAVGMNDALAGSNIPIPSTAHPIWSRREACSMVMTLIDNEETGPAPLNVNVTAAPYNPHGDVQTDWWFGNGSYAPGNMTRIITYESPGNYSLLVRGLDSVGCLSEAQGAVSVTQPGSSSLAILHTSLSVTSFVLLVALIAAVAPIMVLRRRNPQTTTTV
jgi:hypothetical protein